MLQIHREMTIKAHSGEDFRAMTVFAACINFIRDHLMKTLKTTTGDAVAADKIHWVLTVPAIWTDAAKQFMREAAGEVREIAIPD